MRLINVEQGTDSWLEWRRSRICATDVSILMGLNPFSAMTPYDLWVEKFDASRPRGMTPAMIRGKVLEEPARKHFESLIGIEVLPAVGESEIYSWAAASFDGISKDQKTLVEIKVHGLKTYERTLQGYIPEYYQPQFQHQLFVSELDYLYYFPYDGSHGHIVKIYRDEEFIKKMLIAEKDFWHCLETLTPPVMDFIKVENV